MDIATCEVCNNNLIGPILDLGSHPLCDDHAPLDSEFKVVRYHQELQLCNQCLTVHQKHQVKKEILFKPSYKYRASMTQDVLDGMKDLVNTVISSGYVQESEPMIVDIGCNDGSLLRLFKESINCKTIGVDPTDAIDDSINLDLGIKNYFSRESVTEILEFAGRKPDIITFTNVFAHIENFQELLNNLKLLISEHTIVVIENHYLGSILDRFQVDTFYHEHPRTYSATSFQYIASALNLKVLKIEFPKRYGGNIRVILGGKANESNESILRILKEEVTFIDRFSRMQSEYEVWKASAQLLLESEAFKDGFVGKGLPGRAVMLISALNISENQMQYVFEKNKSQKIGFNVPGTKIEVKPDSEFPLNPMKPIVIWPWHIQDEVISYLQALGVHGAIYVPLPQFKFIKEI